ncbi:hypothetical protein JYU34_004795 [Plutella xylostella]|uniref:Alpha-1,6-mannosyl-glycoprotein 2-beta-N-acetylglucosaminyltransferase n=1 Tax=Plutella xylostella TaxID=51655 RepID=A0ABQ7QYV5_PLUXY|nr:hypothetical protein JYU34_004795 [Plutella xylostella]
MLPKRPGVCDYVLIAVLLVGYLVATSYIVQWCSRREQPAPAPADALDGYLQQCGVPAPGLPRLRAFINHSRRTVRNQHIYGQTRPNDTVIVILVRSNQTDLTRLISDFQLVADIDRTLLIFSHFYVSQYANWEIEAIEYARVLQIFFPFTSQVCPDFFPGPNDLYCEYKADCGVVLRGVRDEGCAQRKLFWWWTVNFVFEVADIGLFHNTTVLFMEEDDIVTPDFLYTLMLLKDTAKRECPYCDFLSINGNDPSIYKRQDISPNTAIESAFQATDFSSGLAFNKTIYYKLKIMGDSYCFFNDCGWQSSLQHMTVSALPMLRFHILYVELPRLLKAGALAAARLRPEQLDRHMFPPALHVRRASAPAPGDVTARGNFADVRDRYLCMLSMGMRVFYTNNNTSL